MFVRITPVVFLAALCLVGCVSPSKAPSTPVRVLIIGDSISMNYTPRVRALLGDDAVVVRPTLANGRAENCEGTNKGIKHIDRWLQLDGGNWDVIHFNWGLHDLKYMGPKGENLFPKEKGGKVQVPIGEYEKNLDRLVARLKKTRARLVWRNTTPVPPGSKGRHVGDSIKYNAAAARVMIRHGIPTHDLFTMSKERMKEIMLPANVHYTREGSEVLGGDVAKVILEALK